MCWDYNKAELSTILNIQMFFLHHDFWASQYIIRLESQIICFYDSGTPLSNVNVCRASPKFCNLSGYLSPPTRLPLIAGSQLLARATVGLYYLYNTTYIINLNSIIYQLYHCAILHWYNTFFLFVGSVAQSSFWLLLQAVVTLQLGVAL